MTNVVALSTSALTAPLMAVTALTGEVLAAFDVGNERRQIKELAVTEGGPLENQTLAGVITENVQVLGVVPAAGEAQFLRGVSAETRLQSGDSLIVAGMPQAIGKLSGDRDEDQPALRWAGKVRRFARMARRTLLEVDVAVKIAGAVFAVVVLFSTLVFHFGMGEQLAHGVYHTISVMATGGDMGGEKLTEDWQRVFVSFLRIAGAALVAALTAILTHFLLRARLGGVLELRRIPDSGHVIVCGLGNIGFRVMEELLKQHEQVVVIEQSRDSRFLAGARQQGAVVLIGDATLPDVMQAAHAKHARAVVAATSSELANLSIALLARELNPRQRVVVRLHDMLIAKTLRDAVNVRYAMSIADLSAPAFVAALFCDRVHSLFLMAGKLFVVVEIIVQSGETFFQNQPVASLSAEYKLLTIGLFRGGKLLSSGELAECRLQIDDHWTVIAALQDLERMLEREPAVPVSPP
jgi:Trk K+ transport system NAD-binding subunit